MSHTFLSLELRAELLEALEQMAYAEMTPIQAQSLPPMLQGQDVTGQAGGHRGASIDHGPELTGEFGSPAEPIEIQSEHILDIGDSCSRKPRSSRDPRAGIRREAVDLLASEARVLDRVETRLRGERKRVPFEPAAHLGLTDTRQRCLSFEKFHAADLKPSRVEKAEGRSRRRLPRR